MYKFRKIASAIASAVMVSSTVALAAAANYPAPFVTGGSPNVGIVFGSNAAITDLVAATNIMDNLNSFVVSGSAGGTTPTVTGEAYELFTSGTPLLLNSTLNAVRSTIGESQLPTTLKDGIFETTTNVDYTQRINLGSTPRLVFNQQPTSSDDPQLGFSLSTTASTGYIYNATIIFESNVNLSHADSKSQTLELFGSEFSVGGATSGTKLVLLKSADSITLSNTVPSTEVAVDEATYTVDLVSASDTDARIKVTDSSGASDEKTITESNSKTIKGLEIALDYSDESADGTRVATLLVGSSRITFQDGASVKLGTNETSIEGTQVEMYLTNDSGGGPSDVGKIIVQITAPDSDEDAIFPGGAFVDPVFGSIKVDFTGVSVSTDSTTKRETIEVKNSGNDKMTVKFMSHDGSEAVSTDWAYNKTDSRARTVTTINPAVTAIDLADNDGDPITVREMGAANKSHYVVLASDDEGGLYEVKEIVNATDGYSNDYIVLKNVFTGAETGQIKATSEGTITGFTAQGKTYTISYFGANSLAGEGRTIRVNQDESTGQNMLLFPTIATKKGAKVAFYEPTRVKIDDWNTDASGANTTGVPLGTNATGFVFQDGDGYGTATITIGTDYNVTFVNNYSITFPGGAATNMDDSTDKNRSVSGAIGKLTYNITHPWDRPNVANHTLDVYLVSPQGGNIVRPALIVFEEKDDASNYEAMVVTLDGGYDGSSAGIGISDVVRTWSSDATNDEVQLETNSDLYQEMDIWGSIITVDKSDSDQTTAKISYSDDQVIASVFAAEASASVIGGGGGGGGTTVGVPILDSEVSSAAGKNLIVVGGSCVNTMAASLLGSSTPLCGADFTAQTTVGANQYLIQTFDRTGGTVATLVAGYNAGDTTNAATYLRTQPTVSTMVGDKYVGTTSSSAVLQTATP